MNLRQAIEQLENEILSGFEIFGQTLLKESVLLQHLERIQQYLPDAIAEAEDIVTRHDEILNHAYNLAEEIVANAEHRREQLLLQSGILQQAEKQADDIRALAQQERQEILQQAITEASRVRLEMDRYADNLLGDLEQRLGQSLEVIQDAREHIAPDLERE